MLNILYEDKDILVVVKPAGVEAQASRGFSADMVSQIQNYLYTKLSTDWGKLSTNYAKTLGKNAPPYVGVIHRLDKPVSGIMVYAKTQKAAAALSSQVKAGKIDKVYYAVICGKPVHNVGSFVDYLRKEEKNNTSVIVDKSAAGAKRAELEYRVIDTRIEKESGKEISLVRVHLLTGRHHQIRVQFAGRGLPLWGDNRYHPDFAEGRIRGNIALCGAGLTFIHPANKKKMEFKIQPEGGIFSVF